MEQNNQNPTAKGQELVSSQQPTANSQQQIITPRNKKVFVSGCYDLLHSGHVAFFKEAASYGDLYVGIGSDDTLYALIDGKVKFEHIAGGKKQVSVYAD